MWATIMLYLDGELAFTYEIWLTAVSGSWAKKKRREQVEEAVAKIKRLYQTGIDIAEHYEIIMQIESSVKHYIRQHEKI